MVFPREAEAGSASTPLRDRYMALNARMGWGNATQPQNRVIIAEGRLDSGRFLVAGWVILPDQFVPAIYTVVGIN